MAGASRATQALDRAGIAYAVHRYVYDPAADRIGLHAAAALGVDPARMLKTLMLLIDDRPACAILPSDATLAMKKVAALLGGKTARMMPPADAERLTGYKVGGISPFGQPRRIAMALDASALSHDGVFVNGGQRGLHLVIDPAAIVTQLAAATGAIVA